MEVTYHLTGEYPSWWKGKRFNRGITAWAATVSWADVREVLMEIYMGSQDEEGFGTGTIPKDSIVNWEWNRHAQGVLSSVKIKRKGGGFSLLIFKAYEQGADKFMGAKRDLVHLDEEPPVKIFSECAMRLAQTKGILLLTMTPLNGLTDTCMKFLDADPNDKHYWYVQASWDDNPYLDEEDKAALLAGAEAHLVEARSKGIPALGSGRVFPVTESKILVEPFPLPDHFLFAYGMDFGWTHPTACVFGAKDPDSGVLYLYSCYAETEKSPREHASTLKRDYGGDWIPGAFNPSENRVINQEDGSKILEMYQAEGLLLNKCDNSVDPGILKVLQGLQAGKIRVVNTPAMQGWLREFRIYRRDDKGKIVKRDDDLMDATRYLIMEIDNIGKSKLKAKYGGLKTHHEAPSWMVV